MTNFPPCKSTVLRNYLASLALPLSHAPTFLSFFFIFFSAVMLACFFQDFLFSSSSLFFSCSITRRAWREEEGGS